MSVVPEALRRAVWARAQVAANTVSFTKQISISPTSPTMWSQCSMEARPCWKVSRSPAFPCNRRKGTNLASVDPVSGERAWLFHPRRDRWSDHFQIEGARIVGVTPTGRATVFLFQLNSDERLRVRRHLQRAGRFPQS